MLYWLVCKVLAVDIGFPYDSAIRACQTVSLHETLIGLWSRDVHYGAWVINPGSTLQHSRESHWQGAMWPAVLYISTVRQSRTAQWGIESMSPTGFMALKQFFRWSVWCWISESLKLWFVYREWNCVQAVLHCTFVNCISSGKRGFVQLVRMAHHCYLMRIYIPRPQGRSGF